MEKDLIEEFSKQVLNYESFPHPSIREHLKNQLDKQFHNACNLHNLQYGEQKQSDPLDNHPKEPFPKHQLDKLVHIVYSQYMYRKS
jgi:hypothetical protein